MSKIPLAGSILDKNGQVGTDSVVSNIPRTSIPPGKHSFAFNSCFLCECCCRGYAIVVGSIILAAIELGLQMVFLTYPLIVWSKFFPGFYEDTEKDNSNGARSSVRTYAVIYEGTSVFGESHYFIGTSKDLPADYQRATGQEAAADVGLKRIGLSEDDLNRLSTITIVVPLLICALTILGAATLIIASLIRNPILSLFSSVCHFLVVCSTLAYLIFISIQMDKMFKALEKDGVHNFGDKFNYTYQLWIELAYFFVFFPLASFSTINGIGLYCRFRKSQPSQNPNSINGAKLLQNSTPGPEKGVAPKKISRTSTPGKPEEEPAVQDALLETPPSQPPQPRPSRPPPVQAQAYAQRNSAALSIPVVPFQGPMVSYPGGPAGFPSIGIVPVPPPPGPARQWIQSGGPRLSAGGSTNQNANPGKPPGLESAPGPVSDPEV